MAQPAFQMMGTRSTTSGSFGTCPFGVSPFGGNAWVPVAMPTYHLGSDDLQQKHRQLVAEIVHQRLGVPVSIRKYHEWNLWHCAIRWVAESSLPSLKEFHAARVFNLLPQGEGGETIPVHWVQPEFHPVYVKPGVYAVEFDLEEIPT